MSEQLSILGTSIPQGSTIPLKEPVFININLSEGVSTNVLEEGAVISNGKYTCRLIPYAHQGDTLVMKVKDLVPARKLSERAVNVSKIIDKILITISLLGSAILTGLTQYYKDNPNALQLVSAIAAALDIFILICPVKSSILDKIKK